MGVRLVVTVLIAIFPIITNTLFGLQSTDRLHHDLFTLNHVSRWTRLRKLELPSALPALMAGMRIASGGAVIGSIVADFFFTQGDKGIGYYIRTRQQKAARTSGDVRRHDHGHAVRRHDVPHRRLGHQPRHPQLARVRSQALTGRRPHDRPHRSSTSRSPEPSDPTRTKPTSNTNHHRGRT